MGESKNKFCISRFRGMEQRKYEVELITPLFLGGADPKKAELRIPSFKGALRFWWRAINPHLSLINLKDQEAEIFGDAGNKYGKSKIEIKLTETPYFMGQSKDNPVPHKKAKFQFPCFKPGEKFSLIIRGNYKIFEIFSLFELLSIIGGIGKRSRRGFGSFTIKKIDCKNYDSVNSLDDILQLLKNISHNKFKIDNDKIIRSENDHADYAFIKSIEVGSNFFKSCKDILNKIDQASHDNNSDFTGYARGKEHFASPVYVSVINSSEGYKPVITTLNTSFKDNIRNHGTDKSNQFKAEILSGGA